MAELLRMPEIATGTDEATLVSWPIEVAAEFTESDVIAVVETAKAVVDVEAGRAGVLVRTLVEPGTDVKVGAPIALIAGVGETLGEVDEVLRSLSSDAPAEPAPVPAAAAPALAAPPADLARIFASPLARRMAREGGLALADLTGTGLGGRIVRRDVERALARKSAPASAPAPAAASVEPAADLPEGATAVPHTRLRRLIATRLTESKRTIPHFALRASIEVDDLLALRARINEVSDVKVSVNDLVIKAVAAAHLAVPDANVIWTDEAMVRFAAPYGTWSSAPDRDSCARPSSRAAAPRSPTSAGSAPRSSPRSSTRRTRRSCRSARSRNGRWCSTRARSRPARR